MRVLNPLRGQPRRVQGFAAENTGVVPFCMKITVKKVIIVTTLVFSLYFIFLYLTRDQLNIESLKKTAQKELQLRNSRNYSRVYDEFVSPEAKTKITREDFIKLNKESFDGISISKTEIHDIDIIGTQGYADHTRIDCFDANCTSVNKSRFYNAYLYVNGKWYVDISSKVRLCIRPERYKMPDEFTRALSLIIQRSKESQIVSGKEWGESIREISNCLNIQYAQSEDEIDNAEGVFYFRPGQSPKRLDILVSPKYRIKDDLVTSVLLAHEITHARQFVYELSFNETQISCFEKEAEAFNDQSFFLTLLNQEEMASINARWLTGNSQDVRQLVYVYITIPKFPGRNSQEKALNFVKASPIYQKLCSSNN